MAVTSWPWAIAMDNGIVRGFLMRAVPDIYTFDFMAVTRGGKARLSTVELLLNSDNYVRRSGISISDKGRLNLLGTLGDTISRLHALGIVIGDLSPKNLLFNLKSYSSCFFLDCDAISLRGESALQQVDTPGWEVPAGEEKGTEASDSYKFGLLAIRLFARDQDSRDISAVAALSPELGRLAQLSQDSNPFNRPGPGTWVSAIQSAAAKASSVSVTQASSVSTSWLYRRDTQGSRSSAPDPRLGGMSYDDPSADGLGYDDPLDDESWYEELRRSAPAYPRPPDGRRSAGQRRDDLRGPGSTQQPGQPSQPRRGPADAGPGPAAFLSGPVAASRPPAAPVRPRHGLDGPEITSSWPAQSAADDLDLFEDFWRDDADEEHTGLSGNREAEFERADVRKAARGFARARGILGRGRHRRRPQRAVPRGDATAADVPQSGGAQVHEGNLQSRPGQDTPESTPAETAPGGPIVPSAPAEPVALPVPEQRFLQGRFPERVRLGEEVSLLVRLGLRPGERLEAGLRPVRVPEAGLEIVLLLVDSPGFTLRSPERTVVHVSPRQDSNWASFELQATREGVHTVQVEAFAGGTGLGGLPIQVSVDATTQTGPSMERSSPATEPAADPGEVSLLLSYDADQHVYRYRLVDSGGYYSEEAASDRLLQPPGQAIEQLVTQLNALARGREAWGAATTKDWLKGQGIALWNSFIPQALQREFWQRQDQITQMTIISQGDPVPWELLYPFAPGGRDAGFLVDQFPVVRRRYGPRPPGRLELGVADLVLSRDHSLTAAPAELAALGGLLRDRGIAVRHIDDLPSLLLAFRRGDVGLLHFSCHNAFTHDTPNASRILLRDQSFEPVFLEQHAGRFAAPLVFLNACRTDGQAPLYTTVEGWASSFLRAGAGAFIGSLWEVSDISASMYAQAFYQAALGGHTLGESARRAREAIRDNPGDPTWLAYALYGDPAATISTRAARTD